jgi:predicted house-cleaning noncanonical NTP pyrophosphatase (MazG superfamily)
LPRTFGSPLVSIDQVGQYYDAALAVEWPAGWQAMRIPYNKLVRDRVPRAIEAGGHSCRIEVLERNDYVIELKRKLVEEAQEALESSTQDDLVQELADLTEVIISLSAASGVPFEAIETMRLQRRDQRGGFERRLLLSYVDRAEPTSGRNVAPAE